MTRLVIRKATYDDISSIIEVNLSSTTKDETLGFTTQEWATFSSPDKLMKLWVEDNRLKDGCEVIVAEKDGRLIGYIVFKKERDHIYIDDIDIAKDQQRKGVGRALVTHVENITVASGYSLITTDTTENAQGIPWKSYGFWIKMGYRDTGERLPTKWDFKTIPFTKNLK